MSLDIKLNLVPSAKRLMDISLSITSTKSLIYIRKSKGYSFTNYKSLLQILVEHQILF